jgi:hypothetical protein
MVQEHNDRSGCSHSLGHLPRTRLLVLPDAHYRSILTGFHSAFLPCCGGTTRAVMRVCIHRCTKQIGGTCVEIEAICSDFTSCEDSNALIWS